MNCWNSIKNCGKRKGPKKSTEEKNDLSSVSAVRQSHNYIIVIILKLSQFLVKCVFLHSKQNCLYLFHASDDQAGVSDRHDKT